MIKKRIFAYINAFHVVGLELEIQKLIEAGVPEENVITEKKNYTKWKKLLELLQAGDILYTMEIIRLGKTLSDSFSMIHEVKIRGIDFRPVTLMKEFNKQDLSDPMFDVLFCVAREEYMKKIAQKKEKKYLGRRSYVEICANLLKSYLAKNLAVSEIRYLIGLRLNREYQRKKTGPICLDLYYKSLKLLKEQENILFQNKLKQNEDILV